MLTASAEAAPSTYTHHRSDERYESARIDKRRNRSWRLRRSAVDGDVSQQIAQQGAFRATQPATEHMQRDA